MTFAYNPIRDKEYIINNYQWRTYTIKPSEVEKSQLKYEFIGISNIALQQTNKRHTVKLMSGKEQTLFLKFDPLSLDCIICYKDGTKELAKWDHVYKNNTIYLKGFPLSKIKTTNIDRIILIDELCYHETMLKYWSTEGFSSIESKDARKELIQNILDAA